MLSDRELLGSELRDKIELYSELTGEDGWSVPVARVADFISGFEMGKERFRKRGHWITERISEISGDKWSTNPKCSICGGEPYYSNSIFNYKYCPYCGAYMGGEE